MMGGCDQHLSLPFYGFLMHTENSQFLFAGGTRHLHLDMTQVGS